MAFGHRKRKELHHIKRGSKYPLSKHATVEAGHRAYELKWLRSLLGLRPVEAAAALKVNAFDYALWEQGRTAIPSNAAEKLAASGGLDLSYVPQRVIGAPPFPPHPYPGQLDYGVKSLLAFAEHRMIELDKLSAWDYLMLVQKAIQPLPGYPL
jgi:DNA-binding transcriptional regulator YiaG